MVNDTISDVLTRIRNALMAEKRSVIVTKSKMVKRILDVLLREGYIDGYDEVLDKDAKFPCFEVQLKYDSNGTPVIAELDRVSKPGCRVYSSCKELPVVRCGLGIAVVSTSKGVVSDKEARRLGVGGEVLLKVF